MKQLIEFSLKTYSVTEFGYFHPNLEANTISQLFSKRTGIEIAAVQRVNHERFIGIVESDDENLSKKIDNCGFLYHSGSKIFQSSDEGREKAITSLKKMVERIKAECFAKVNVIESFIKDLE